MALAGWACRKSHVVTVNSIGSYYPTRIYVHRSTGTDSTDNVYIGTICNSDFSDLRFTDSGGTTLIPHYIESYSGSVATVWVRVAASTSSTTIYLYWGKPDATDASSTTTFANTVLYDDFPGSTINTTYWRYAPTTYSIANSQITISSGRLSSKANIVGVSGELGQPGSAFTAYASISSGVTSAEIGYSECNSGVVGEYYKVGFVWISSTLYTRTRNWDRFFGNQFLDTAIGGNYADDFHTWEIKWVGVNEAKFYIDGTLVSTHTSCLPKNSYDANTAYKIPIVIQNTSGTGSLVINYTHNINTGSMTNSTWGTEESFVIANFTSDVTTGQIPLAVQFTDTSTSYPTGWSWDFGDGNSSTSQNPSHTYASVGTYTVSLTATGSLGSHTVTKTAYISARDKPATNFIANKAAGIPALTVQFTDTSLNAPTSWSWTFGDGNTSTSQNPSHVYAASGMFSVTLTATNTYGSDTVTKTNYINVSAPVPPNRPTWLSGWQYRKRITYDTDETLDEGIITIFVHRTWGTDNNNHIYVGKKCVKNYGDIVFTDYKHNPIPSCVVYWNQHISEIKVRTNSAIPILFMYYGGSTEIHHYEPAEVLQTYDNFNDLEDRWTKSNNFTYLESTNGISPYKDIPLNTVNTITSKTPHSYDNWEIGFITSNTDFNDKHLSSYSIGVTYNDGSAKYTNLWFGNKTAFSNAVEFFSDINGVLTLRSSEYTTTGISHPILIKLKKIGGKFVYEALTPYRGNAVLHSVPATGSSYTPAINFISWVDNVVIKGMPSLNSMYVAQIIDVSAIAIHSEEARVTSEDLTKWRFVKKVNVTNSTVLLNRVISFNIHRYANTDTATDIYIGAYGSPEFRDIRVYDNNGVKLPFYIEEHSNIVWESILNGSSSRIFIKIPTINTSSYIWIYYGNRDAINESAPESVFLYYDNFLIHGSADKTSSSIAISPNTDIHSKAFSTRVGGIAYNAVPTDYCKLLSTNIPVTDVSVRLRVRTVSPVYSNANIGLCSLDISNRVLDYVINPFNTVSTLPTGIGGETGTIPSGTSGHMAMSEMMLSVSPDVFSISTLNTYIPTDGYSRSRNQWFKWTAYGTGTTTDAGFSERWGTQQRVSKNVTSPNIDSFAIVFGAGSKELIIHDICVMPYVHPGIIISAESQILNGSIGKSSVTEAFAPAYVSFGIDPESNPADSVFLTVDSNIPKTLTVSPQNGESISSTHILGITSCDIIPFLNSAKIIIPSDQTSNCGLYIDNILANLPSIFPVNFIKEVGVLNTNYTIEEFSYGNGRDFRYAIPADSYIHALNTGVITYIDGTIYKFPASSRPGLGGTTYYSVYIPGNRNAVTDIGCHEMLHAYGISSGYHCLHTPLYPIITAGKALLGAVWGIVIEGEIIPYTSNLFSKRGYAAALYNFPGVYHPQISTNKGLTYDVPPITIYGLSFEYDIGTAGQVTFTNHSSDNLSFVWDFGDGNSSTVTSPVHTYSDLTLIYKITLTATTPTGLTETKYETLNFSQSGISVEQVKGPIFSFSFVSESVTPVSYEWNFGDGSTSIKASPVHPYTAPGEYLVTLRVTDATPATYDYQVTFIVPESAFPPVISAINMAVDELISATTVAFSSTVKHSSTSTITGYLWNFGDGITSTEQTPSHVYASEGTYIVTLTVSDNFGVFSEPYSSSILISSDPLNFTYSPTNAKIDATVTFNAKLGYTSYLWDFGDGNTSIVAAAVHTYRIAGTYTVTLTVSNGGIHGAVSKPLIISSPAALDFSFTPNESPIGTEITFIASLGYSHYCFDFGDGSVSYLADSAHSYTKEGEYQVILTACGAIGDPIVSVSKTVMVISGESAFYAKTPRGKAPLKVMFINESPETVDSYLWDFGDGQTSTDRHPTHTYLNPETYSVKLTTTKGSKSNTRIRESYICATETDPPTAGFTMNVREGLAPLTVQFTDTSIGIVSSSWDFGDGQTSTELNPQHIYSSPGFYIVTRRVYNLDWESECISSVNVEDMLNVTSLATPISGYSPLKVRFRSMIEGVYRLISWNFGDGTISTEVSPEHLYSVPGIYLVTLSVYQNTAIPVTVTKTVTIKDPALLPAAKFSADVMTGLSPLAVQFTDGSTGSPTSWSWNFGDGNTSTSQNPSHIYSSPGSYTVTLKVTNSYGHDTVIKAGYIRVVAAPVGEIGIDTDIGYASHLFTFRDESLFDPTSWSWNYGDGNTSTEQNPTHTFSLVRSYWVTLTVTNAHGTDTIGRDITIVPTGYPIVSFTYNFISRAVPMRVSFSDTSQGSPTSWLWDFGDGGISTEQNPVHTYYHSGEYVVSLTVTNSTGTMTRKERISYA